eukprot:184262_1
MTLIAEQTMVNQLLYTIVFAITFIPSAFASVVIDFVKSYENNEDTFYFLLDNKLHFFLQYAYLIAQQNPFIFGIEEAEKFNNKMKRFIIFILIGFIRQEMLKINTKFNKKYKQMSKRLVHGFVRRIELNIPSEIYVMCRKAYYFDFSLREGKRVTLDHTFKLAPKHSYSGFNTKKKRKKTKKKRKNYIIIASH